jgi:hypothetical protein
MSTVDTAAAVLVLGVQEVAKLDPIWLVSAIGGSIVSLFFALFGLFLVARQRIYEDTSTQRFDLSAFDWPLIVSMAAFYGGLSLGFLTLLVVAIR